MYKSVSFRKLNFKKILQVASVNSYEYSGKKYASEICQCSKVLSRPLLKPQKDLYLKNNSFVHTSSIWFKEENDNDENEEEGKFREYPKFRKNVISFEVSKRYLESEAYKETYGDEPVWVKYRRNFKGQFAPKLTRPFCIDNDGKVVTGNPCPLCRDEYLIVDFRNVKLLQQFVSPYTDLVLPWSKTQICQNKQIEVDVAIEKSRMHGLLKFFVPFREYNYKDYYDFPKQLSK